MCVAVASFSGVMPDHLTGVSRRQRRVKNAASLSAIVCDGARGLDKLVKDVEVGLKVNDGDPSKLLASCSQDLRAVS